MSIYCNNLYKYRDQILTEAYIGKTETLLEIEKQIGIIRNNLSFYDNINKSKEVLKLNRLIEKQFNPKICGVKIYKSDVINAYTRVIATRFDIAENIRMHEMVTGNKVDGYKFKDNNDFCLLIYISYALLKDKKFTDSEIVAVILHEIGHNFADCIYDKIEFANSKIMEDLKNVYYSNKILIFFTYLARGNIKGYIKLVKYMNNEYNDKIRSQESKSQHKKPNKLKGLMSGLVGKSKNFKSFINEVIIRMQGDRGINRYKSKISDEDKEKIRNSLNRQNEVIADKFAGIYGYGPDQASALMKMDLTRSKADKFIDNHLYKGARKNNDKLNKAALDINDYDSHPHTIQRIYEEIKLLKRELEKDDLDPKVADMIKKQIDQCNKIIEEYIKTSNKFSKNENAKRAYAAFVNDNCPDAIAEEFEAAIEEALDNALEEEKNKEK